VYWLRDIPPSDQTTNTKQDSLTGIYRTQHESVRVSKAPTTHRLVKDSRRCAGRYRLTVRQMTSDCMNLRHSCPAYHDHLIRGPCLLDVLYHRYKLEGFTADWHMCVRKHAHAYVDRWQVGQRECRMMRMHIFTAEYRTCVGKHAHAVHPYHGPSDTHRNHKAQDSKIPTIIGLCTILHTRFTRRRNNSPLSPPTSTKKKRERSRRRKVQHQTKNATQCSQTTIIQ
jgi:hypothetical protein